MQIYLKEEKNGTLTHTHTFAARVTVQIKQNKTEYECIENIQHWPILMISDDFQQFDKVKLARTLINATKNTKHIFSLSILDYLW